jgi:hypothetical protein
MLDPIASGCQFVAGWLGLNAQTLLLPLPVH